MIAASGYGVETLDHQFINGVLSIISIHYAKLIKE